MRRPESRSFSEDRRLSLDPARKVCEHCPRESLRFTPSRRAQRTFDTVKPFWGGFGVTVEAVVLSDANAGIGIASRQGYGRLKHLEVKWLWVQEKVSEKALKLCKHPTETNLADLATKYLSRHRIEMLLAASHLVLIREQEGKVSTL